MRKNRRRGTLASWLSAGERLLRVDPVRMEELLELAEQFALAHEDPNAPSLREIASELTQFPKSSNDTD